jgi:hypothetical protein
MATEISRTNDGHFVVWFEDDAIRTTLSDSGDVVDSWLDMIYRIHHRRLNRLVVGLDVEWRPCTNPADVHPVAVLQICVGHRCLVFQILHADYIPESLSGFLADDRFTFVGVGVHDDAAKLWSDYGLQLGRAVDLRSLAANTLKKPALGRAGLQALVSEVMGVKMDKPQHVRRSAWDARNLSSDQLMYACADAFASFEVCRWLYSTTTQGHSNTNLCYYMIEKVLLALLLTHIFLCFNWPCYYKLVYCNTFTCLQEHLSSVTMIFAVTLFLSLVTLHIMADYIVCNIFIYLSEHLPVLRW